MWVGVYTGGKSLGSYYGMLGWHSHEMIFGYAVAVISGFLLTAVRNWTGRTTAQGAALLALAALWLAGRVVPWMTIVLPPWLIAFVDAAFLPALLVALASPLWASRQRHNLIFIPWLALLAAANVLVHLQALGITEDTARVGTSMGLNLILLLIAIIGGRVIPFFTERAIEGVRTRRWRLVEALALISVVAFLVADLIDPRPLVFAVIAAAAAGIHGLRLAGWYSKGIWSVPLLWILHVGYAWLVVGFALQALVVAGMVAPPLGVHAFTAGAIGVMTLGMMARVALGHTGRPLQPVRSVVLAFVLVNGAAVVHVGFPLIAPSQYSVWIAASGVLWVAAFVLFIRVYGPILTRARADGRPG